MVHYKVLTHDLRPPIQGGEPLWAEGTGYPVRIPATRLDEGLHDCAAGWNACSTPHKALALAGLWPNGHPSRLFEVASESGWIVRRDKARTAGPLVVQRELVVSDDILATLHTPMTGNGLPISDLVGEVRAWLVALARPGGGDVEKGLREALAVRGLSAWHLEKFPTSRDAWDAWDAWDARDASVAWVTWDARVARNASVARAAWDAWNAWDAWVTWDARVARNASAAWDARAALVHFVATRRGGLDGDPHQLTTGLRDAYVAGLQVAFPTRPGELGWA